MKIQKTSALIIFLILALLSACVSSGTTPTNIPVDNLSPVTAEPISPTNKSSLLPFDISRGQIAFQKIGADGKPILELALVSEADGALRTVYTPNVVITHFPIQASQRALLYTVDQKYYLFNTEAGTMNEIIFPLKDGLDQWKRPASPPQIQGGGKYWTLFLSSETGRLIFLVNLLSGEVFDLRNISKEFFNGAFTPSEDKLLLFSDGIWLVPMSDPRSATRLSLCDAQLISFTLSDYGREFMYICGPLGDTTVYLQRFDGSSPDYITKGVGIEQARFVPGKRQALLFSVDSVNIFSFRDMKEENLMHFAIDAHSGPIQFTADGRYFLYERLTESPSLYLIDTESGNVTPLDKLDRYQPLIRPDGEWIILVGTPSFAGTNELQFAILDLVSGQIHQILSLSDVTATFRNVMYSPTYDTALIHVQVSDKVQQLYLINWSKLESKLLADGGLLSGEYSPDGRWVVISKWNFLDNNFSAEVSLMTTDGSPSILLGNGTAPLWVYP